MSVDLVARCVRGLEWVLAAEVTDGDVLGEVRLSERQVHFTVGAPSPALLDLHTADDLLLDLGALHGIDHTRAAIADLSRQLARIDFDGALGTLEQVRPLPGKLGFDVVASLLGRRNYNRFAVEDAAGEVIEDLLGARYLSRNPDSDTAGNSVADIADTDFTVRLSLSGDAVEVGLRLSRKPLHRRAWKLDTGPGTLHPPLAAALAHIAGPITSALDPFCGDGTIAVETALAFPGAAVLAADLDADRLRNAEANAARAALSSRIRFERADAGRADYGAERFDLVVTNPPWNRVVGAAGELTETLYLEPFWQRLPDVLSPAGRVCTIAEAELRVPELLRRAGYAIALCQTVRIAGRVSQIVLATPPDLPEVRLSGALGRWRERAIEAGIVSEDGF